MRILSLCLLSVYSLFIISHAHAADNNKFQHPLYFGLTGGYGWTTWEGLVPPESKQNLAMAMSTPKYIDEGGSLWGVFAGYELLPYFALEVAYMHYPNATVSFDGESIFTFEHEGITSFTTKTETISLMAKIMMIIPRSDFRAYSSFGYAELHRKDDLNSHWIPSPTFGLGVNYNFTANIMGEIGANYTAGRGTSELNPIEDYYPFVYSAFVRLAYRI